MGKWIACFLVLRSHNLLSRTLRVNDFQFLHTSYEQPDSAKSGVTNSVKLPDIYLVEDDRVLGATIKKYLEKKLNLNVHFFLTPTECLLELDKKIKSETVVNQTPFCLITDISFEVGGSAGLLLIGLLKERGHHFVSIVMTGFASNGTAIKAT